MPNAKISHVERNEDGSTIDIELPVRKGVHAHRVTVEGRAFAERRQQEHQAIVRGDALIARAGSLDGRGEVKNLDLSSREDDFKAGLARLEKARCEATGEKDVGE